VADEKDDIRALLEQAVAGESAPATIADPPELAEGGEEPPVIDSRPRDEMGRFAPKAEDAPATKETRSRRAA
jgi:hypothetical protein